jgi:hypothetical protein
MPIMLGMIILVLAAGLGSAGRTRRREAASAAVTDEWIRYLVETTSLGPCRG